ncbi:hypothetical protein ABVT39_012163 [Epinephelus coioides]
MGILIDACPPATLRGIVVTQQAEAPQRSASQQKRQQQQQQQQQRFPAAVLRPGKTALSRLQSPRASNTAFMVPGFAARMLCLIKGPWNSDRQAEKRRRRRRREQDAWYLTSGKKRTDAVRRRGAACVERRESEPGAE